MNPKYITVHCSATRPKNNYSVSALRITHVETNGWSDIGYHFYITTDGKLHECRPLNRNGAHVKGHNTDNIGVCLEGGLNNDTGKPDDTYNHHQMETLKSLIQQLKGTFKITNETIQGHRDWYGDRSDWLKMCPCFDVKKWLEINKV